MAELDTSGGGKKKGKGRRTKKMSTRIDLTPMVDLGFLLVTFFMLTTTFSKPQTMEINLPVKDKTAQEQEQAVKASKALTIILSDEHKVYYYSGIEDPVLDSTTFSTTGGIRKIIQEKIAAIPELNVLIKPTEKATYKDVVDILDEMNITGVKRYALVDVTEFDLNLLVGKK